MRSHAVLVGYSTRGRVVLSTLFAAGHATDFTVVDSDPGRVAQAEVDGVRAVVGEGWRLDVLWAAGAHTSDHVVVAVTDDALALRITSVVRSVNEDATITTVVRSEELRELIEFLGADHVLAAEGVGEWSRAMARVPHERHPQPEWTVLRRPVARDEIGSSPLACGSEVLAVFREGRRIWVEDPAVGELRHDDVLVVLSSAPAGG
ncbi:NAD(P)-binding protein [Lentzea sp. NPDC060358]|uniref:NAD(P)-binding protein n=1 Tax=Lentzea sp. NPDC060358 TaxID=3347103 RepID=UPI003654D57A